MNYATIDFQEWGTEDIGISFNPWTSVSDITRQSEAVDFLKERGFYTQAKVLEQTDLNNLLAPTSQGVYLLSSVDA